MDPMILAGLIILGIGAGVLGALFGLGGGVVFIPVLTLVFGLTTLEAAAVSLVGIIVGSATASSVYIKEDKTNIHLGLLLELTTTIGAIAGAMIATYMQDWILTLIFSAVVFYSGIRMLMIPEAVINESDENGRLTFEYEKDDGERSRYTVQNVGKGSVGCLAAGMVSSMTGIGGGAIKVPIMNLMMHVPMKVAVATSSYMIGITAFSGAIVYYLAGQMNIEYAGALAIGALVGAYLGAYLSKKIDTKDTRKYFSIVMFAIAITMIVKIGVTI